MDLIFIFISIFLLFQTGLGTQVTDDQESQHLRGFGDDKGFPYTWVCRESSGTCVKMSKSFHPTNRTQLPLLLCKLSCGKNGVLWPLPTGKVEIEKDLIHFSRRDVEFAPFQVEDSAVKDMLTKASDIFTKYLEQMEGEEKSDTDPQTDVKKEGPKVVITFSIAWTDRINTLTTDESYVLSIRPSDDEKSMLVDIMANTYFGGRHGLETLSQLIAYDEETQSFAIVKTVMISDKPVFPYRGILIDTARNFFSIGSLKRLIDGMSYTKLNILHWHITDTHSFPFYSKRAPQMSHYGAYSKKKVYSPKQIHDLIDYARIRGVKIVPEFDEPAHTGNGWEWGPSKGLGNLAVCVNKEPWESYCVEPPCGQLNVINENMYNVLGDIFKDMFDLFDHDIFHMGGDEINFNCWNSTKEITDWMTSNGMERTHQGFLQLWSRFQNKAYEKVKEANGGTDVTSIMWTSDLTHKDVVEKYLNNSTYIIQIWTQGDDDLIPFLVSKNYRIILSNYDAWYFDCGYGAWVGNSPNNWCTPYKGWQQMYSNSPLLILANKTSLGEAENALSAGLVLGGVGAMWSEQVDEEAVEGKIWPRGLAMGERLWSNPSSSWEAAEIRMIATRQRYVERGLKPDQLQPEWCHQNEGKCILKG